MTNWVKQLFGSTDKALDILNVGRLIFYTAAGYLAIYPIAMIFRLLGARLDASQATIYSSFRANMLDLESWHLFFVALVSGFVVAQSTFTTITTALSSDARHGLARRVLNKSSFNYIYPFLKNEKEEDYQAWLISEYFRFVEIGTILPVGFIVGLYSIAAYTVAYLLKFNTALTISAIQSAVLLLIAITIVIACLVYYVWPAVWRPKVALPTVAAYFSAKRHLVQGVKDYYGHLAAESKSKD